VIRTRDRLLRRQLTQLVAAVVWRQENCENAQNLAHFLGGPLEGSFTKQPLQRRWLYFGWNYLVATADKRDDCGQNTNLLTIKSESATILSQSFMTLELLFRNHLIED